MTYAPPPEMVPPDIGSEFHWDPAVLTAGGDDWLPARRELFATGCGALTALLRHLRPRGRLHVPSYFCMGVAEALAADVPIAFYRHLPDDGGPRWETLHAEKNDVVLAQNLFGRDGGSCGETLRAEKNDVVLAQNLFGRDDDEPWNAWMAAHPGVTVIEDHSHDPLSAWARRSRAPFAIASLRKTLPVPDGGLLWSPQGRDIPEPEGRESAGAHLKLAAMVLKSAWIDGHPVAKDHFRSLQLIGEQTLLGSTGPASTFTSAVLPLVDAAGLRQKGIENALALPEKGDGWRMLGAGPFRAQLICDSETTRNDLLRHLAAHAIYAPVHWRQDRGGLWSGDDEAADLGERMLTVPADHRCGPSDVRRIASVLLAFRRAGETGAAAGPAPAA